MEHVRKLFSGAEVELEFERGELEFPFASIADAVDTFATKFGPVVKARELLEPQGRWPALRDDLTAFFERRTTAADSRVSYQAEYLVVLGRKVARRRRRHGAERRRLSDAVLD